MARAKKIIDNSPKFDKTRYYAIGTLKQNRATADVPEGFADNPKALHIAGTDLLNAGMKSCRDFLVSSNCQFKLGSAVHFYDVEYRKEGEPLYTNIFIGSPLLQAPPAAEQVLSDGSGAPIHTINNIIPNTNSTEYEKMFFKSQEEAIAHYRRCLQDERQDFGKERILYTNKLQEQSDKILELNLAINTLKAENEALRIKYEEAQKFADRLERLTRQRKSPYITSAGKEYQFIHIEELLDKELLEFPASDNYLADNNFCELMPSVKEMDFGGSDGDAPEAVETNVFNRHKDKIVLASGAFALILLGIVSKLKK